MNGLFYFSKDVYLFHLLGKVVRALEMGKRDYQAVH